MTNMKKKMKSNTKVSKSNWPVLDLSPVLSPYLRRHSLELVNVPTSALGCQTS